MLPFSTCHLVSFISSIFVGIFAFIVDMSILQKYRIAKTNVRLSVMLMIGLLALAILIDPIFFAVSRVVANTPAEGDFIIDNQGAWSFALVGFANLCLAYFVQIVFYEKKPRHLLYLYWVVELGLSILLPINAMVGFFDNFYTFALQLIISLILYLLQFIASINLSAKISPGKEHAAHKRAIQAIGLAGFLLTLTIFCFVLQEFAGDIGLADSLGCSYFIPIAWLLAGLSTFSIYLGYFMPDWLKKRYLLEKKE